MLYKILQGVQVQIYIQNQSIDIRGYEPLGLVIV